MSVSGVIEEHAARGRRFVAAGVESFALDQGQGPAVVLLHGVPASAWLYRKVVPGLAARGLRGVAFDLPGLGLADRPIDFDYRWTGLGAWAAAAVDALGIDELHLVVHDIGGPVGFELAAALPERVRSLTILNTLIAVNGFRRPWEMKPFAVPLLGRLWLAGAATPLFRAVLARSGFADPLPRDEVAAYAALLRRGDGGRAFLRIMRGFELTAAKQALYEEVVRDPRRPTQVVWGADDPALRLAREGAVARALVGEASFHTVRGRHFFPDDQHAVVSERVAAFVAAPPSGR